MLRVGPRLYVTGRGNTTDPPITPVGRCPTAAGRGHDSAAAFVRNHGPALREPGISRVMRFSHRVAMRSPTAGFEGRCPMDLLNCVDVRNGILLARRTWRNFWAALILALAPW